MTPEERALLESTHTLAKENNEILRSIRRTSRINIAFRVFYWIIIIGLSLGAFYFIQPYIDSLKGITGSVNSTTTTQNYAQQLEDLLR